ncbi:hypothetical protein LXL04_004417 [Taraxacum kok-saghyz]
MKKNLVCIEADDDFVDENLGAERVHDVYNIVMCYWYIVQGIHVDCGGCKESERKDERRPSSLGAKNKDIKRSKEKTPIIHKRESTKHIQQATQMSGEETEDDGAPNQRRERDFSAIDFALLRLLPPFEPLPSTGTPTTSSPAAVLFIGERGGHRLLLRFPARVGVSFEHGCAAMRERERERESGSFENSYISENPRTPKPLTFSKNRFRGAKNRSNTSPVTKKISEKTTFFF